MGEQMNRIVETATINLTNTRIPTSLMTVLVVHTTQAVKQQIKKIVLCKKKKKNIKQIQFHKNQRSYYFLFQRKTNQSADCGVNRNISPSSV